MLYGDFDVIITRRVSLVGVGGILAVDSQTLQHIQPDALIDLRCIYRCDADNRLPAETSKDAGFSRSCQDRHRQQHKPGHVLQVLQSSR